MKKIMSFLSIALLAINMLSCATIRDGHVTTYQRTKPKAGEPQREVKIGALVWDIIIWGGAGLIVDFATGAIYKPSTSK